MNASQIESLVWLKTVFDNLLQPFMDVFLPGLTKDDDLFNGLLLLTSRNPDVSVKALVGSGKAGNPYPKNFNELTNMKQPNSASKPVQTTSFSVYRVFDILLNQTMNQARSLDNEKYQSFYKAFYGRMNKTSVLPMIFASLQYSTLPCFDRKGITSEIDGEKSILKFCSWKSIPIPCSSIFTTFPTDQGMCCSFNMKAAEEIFLGKTYSNIVSENQRDDKNFSFANLTLDDWYEKQMEPRCHFHQHSMSSFCANILAPKNYKAKLQAQKVFGTRILVQKLVKKCW